MIKSPLVVWAIDLDSADSLSAQYLQSGGDLNNNRGFTPQKHLAITKQRVHQNLGFWTPCLSTRDRQIKACPDGFHDIGMIGQGSVYAFDNYKVVGGCNGRLNRVFCLRNDLVEQKCQWSRTVDGGKFCDDSCPHGTWFLTQNTQPAGDRFACAHGSYVAVCCQDIIPATSQCPTTAFDVMSSGGMANTGNAANAFGFGAATGLAKRDGNGSALEAPKRKRANNNGRRVFLSSAFNPLVSFHQLTLYV